MKDDTLGEAPKEWKNFFMEFTLLRREILQKIFSLDEERKKQYLKMLDDHAKKSFSSVEDPEKYVVYHRSVGGSVGLLDAPQLDFEGKYSLVKFYKKLLQEIALKE